MIALLSEINVINSFLYKQRSIKSVIQTLICITCMIGYLKHHIANSNVGGEENQEMVVNCVITFMYIKCWKLKWAVDDVAAN